MPAPTQMSQQAGKPASTSNPLAGVLTTNDTWLDCTSVTTSGGAITAFIDRNNSSRSFASVSSASAPTTDSALNNQLSCACATARYNSNQAASFWNNMNNGTGAEWFIVFVPTGSFSVENYLFNNEGSTDHVALKYSTVANYEVRNSVEGGSSVYTSVTHGMTLSTGYVLNGYSTTAAYTLTRNGTSLEAGAPAGPHGTVTPSKTLQLFDDGFGTYFVGRFAMLLIFNRVLSSGDRTTVRSYITSTYGITA